MPDELEIVPAGEPVVGGELAEKPVVAADLYRGVAVGGGDRWKYVAKTNAPQCLHDSELMDVWRYLECLEVLRQDKPAKAGTYEIVLTVMPRCRRAD
jgi:hypothetical protein